MRRAAPGMIRADPPWPDDGGIAHSLSPRISSPRPGPPCRPLSGTPRSDRSFTQRTTALSGVFGVFLLVAVSTFFPAGDPPFLVIARTRFLSRAPAPSPHGRRGLPALLVCGRPLDLSGPPISGQGPWAHWASRKWSRNRCLPLVGLTIAASGGWNGGRGISSCAPPCLPRPGPLRCSRVGRQGGRRRRHPPRRRPPAPAPPRQLPCGFPQAIRRLGSWSANVPRSTFFPCPKLTTLYLSADRFVGRAQLPTDFAISRGRAPGNYDEARKKGRDLSPGWVFITAGLDRPEFRGRCRCWAWSRGDPPSTASRPGLHPSSLDAGSIFFSILQRERESALRSPFRYRAGFFLSTLVRGALGNRSTGWAPGMVDAAHARLRDRPARSSLGRPWRGSPRGRFSRRRSTTGCKPRRRPDDFRPRARPGNRLSDFACFVQARPTSAPEEEDPRKASLHPEQDDDEAAGGGRTVEARGALCLPGHADAAHGWPRLSERPPGKSRRRSNRRETRGTRGPHERGTYVRGGGDAIRGSSRKVA